MRKTIKIRITKTPKDFLKYASNLHILVTIFLVKIQLQSMKKELLTLNKPIYVGCTVLELSKLAMYKFYYDFIKRKYEDVKLLYTNTDSFIIEITGEDFDEIMIENKEFFDQSNFSKDSKYYCADNKKVPGKMKD